VHDVKTLGTYGARLATRVRFGRRFLARGGKVRTLQGEPRKGRAVVIAFDSPERTETRDAPH
jgi:uncharacterized protein (DUF1330 family)